MLYKIKRFFEEIFKKSNFDKNHVFIEELAQQNIKRLIIISLLGFFLSVCYVFYFRLNMTAHSLKELLWASHIFYSHLYLASFFVVSGLTAMLIRRKSRRLPFLVALHVNFVFFILITFGVLISSFDQYVTNAITPFLISVIFVSLGLFVRPVMVFFSLVYGLILFWFVHPYFQPNQDVFISNFVNAASVEGIAFLLSFMLWSNNLIRYNQNKKIQEQKNELEEQLKISRKYAVELEIANNSKNRFFSIIAHDLRGPIGAMMNLLNLLTDKEYSASQSKQSMDAVLSDLQQSSSSTFDLLENLLVWARSQQNELEYDPKELRISEVIAETVEAYRLQASQKQISVHVRNIHEDNLIFADRNMVKTIVRNLLGNAIKFSPLQSEVILSFHEELDYDVICVEDFGIGVSSQNRDALFNVNFNVSTFGTMNEKGTGLGLVLCKDFMDRHDGVIEIRSKQSQGAIFAVKFPKK